MTLPYVNIPFVWFKTRSLRWFESLIIRWTLWWYFQFRTIIIIVIVMIPMSVLFFSSHRYIICHSKCIPLNFCVILLPRILNKIIQILISLSHSHIIHIWYFLNKFLKLPLISQNSSNSPYVGYLLFYYYYYFSITLELVH